MSIQETHLQAIADAIRAVDGTTEPILARTFPDRIRALRGGDGGSSGSITVMDITPYEQIWGACVSLADRVCVEPPSWYSVLEGQR